LLSSDILTQKESLQMAMKKQILDKLARDLEQLGMSVTRGSANEVVVENGSADVTLSYADASFSPSMMGGVDGSASPYLGIGTGNPGKITLRVAGCDTLATALATATPVKCLAKCAGFANDINVLVDSTGATLLAIRGHADLIGMGE
jgi:hypothetical protein